MQQLGCDFFVFSGHKIFAPTGIGGVYAKEELLEVMPPWQGGGSMIRNVTFEETTYADPPAKFEAGTPNIGDAVGLGAALDYVKRLGLPNIARHEHELLEYATGLLSAIKGLRIVGTAREKVGRDFVRPAESPHGGYRPGAGPGGHRRAGRPSLRPADHAAVWCRIDRAAFVLALQYQGGNRPAGGRGPKVIDSIDFVDWLRARVPQLVCLVPAAEIHD